MNLSEDDQQKLLADFVDAVELASEAVAHLSQRVCDRHRFGDRLHDLKDGILYYSTKVSDGD